MKILRLSFFNLNKNKREVLGILFMTMITTMMLSIVLMNREKINMAFDESFRASESADHCITFKTSKYRNAFKTILEKEFGIDGITEGHFLYSALTDVYAPDGDVVSYNLNFTTEKTERKMEAFRKAEQLPEEEIATLEHPIWMPVAFQIVKGYQVGDSFTVLKNAKEYPFTIAGFYETGLMSSDGYFYKLIISEEDYELFRILFDSTISYETVGLFFNTADLDYDAYLEKCNEAASENLSFSSSMYCYSFEKGNETMFLEMFMYMLIFLALVTLVASLFMIRHKISGDIEDQMIRIGVLEALGYRSHEISLAYLYEYMLTGGVGSALGTIAAILITPLVNAAIRKMLGRSVYGATGIGGGILAAFLISMIVTLFALLKARTVKNYPPVVALRKGIATHHFGKNILPLEKLRSGINLGLAVKGFFGNLKTSFGIGICIVTAGTALIFAALSYDFFKDGVGNLVSMMGVDTDSLQVKLISGVDPETIREEMLRLPQVRKALLTCSFEYVSIKGSSDAAQVNVFEDYKDAENVKPYTGRCPQYDNEVMVGMRRARNENIQVGDSIILENNGLEKKYVVSGIIGTMENSGTVIYLTTNGFKRINIQARENTVQVYPAEGISLAELEEVIREHFGGTAEDAAVSSGAEDTEARIRKAADEKIAVMLDRYGVTNVDYAVQIGDEVYIGNSRNYVIKEITSFEGIIKTQMVPIGNTTKQFTFYAMILIAVIVAVLLMIVTSNDVRRQRQNLGIMKGLGYSSKDLMTQIAMKMMPVILIGVLLASVGAVYLNRFFWSVSMATIAVTNVWVIVITDVLLILFCYAVAFFSAGRIRKISVTELMTE